MRHFYVKSPKSTKSSPVRRAFLRIAFEAIAGLPESSSSNPSSTLITWPLNQHKRLAPNGGLQGRGHRPSSPSAAEAAALV